MIFPFQMHLICFILSGKKVYGRPEFPSFILRTKEPYIMYRIIILNVLKNLHSKQKPENSVEVKIFLPNAIFYFSFLLSIAFATAITAGNSTAAITQIIHPSFQLSVGRVIAR